MKGRELFGAENFRSNDAIGPYQRSLELSITDSVSASGATDLPARNRNFKLEKEYRVMISTKMYRAIVCAVVFGALVAVAPSTFAQDSNQQARTSAQKEEDVNLDTQLYLILATNRDVEDARMPSTLEPVMKRLHDSLPFKHYALAGTFLNRVRNTGRLEVSWVGGPLLLPASAATNNPSFSQFTAGVKLSTDESGREVVRMNEFRFGARVPIVTSRATASNAAIGETSIPVINYENIGLRTDISMREDVPIIAGTLNIGASGDAIVVVIAAKRAN